MADQYVQRTVVVKNRKDEGKIKRWVVTPLTNLAKWKIDDKQAKADRVSA